MTSRQRDVVVAGVAEAELTDSRLPDVTVMGAQARVAAAALGDAGLNFRNVDGLAVAGMWGVPGAGQQPTMAMAEYLGLKPHYVDGTNIGGSSFEAHLAHAAAAIAEGRCECVLVTYGSRQRSERSRGVPPRPELSAQYDAPHGLLSPLGAYAMAAHRHMAQYGTTSEQLAQIAVAARGWANLNPAATAKGELTVDDVLSSRMISDPLHVRDSCLVTDGAGAFVLTSAECAPDLGRPNVCVRGYGEASTHYAISSMPDLTTTPAAISGPEAMAMAGIGHDDIDVLLAYDSFTVTVLLTLEALGFCKPGEGGSFVADGRIAPGGSFPMNTSGGGLSHLHPGMYGVFLVVEAVRQLRGECGERQVRDAEVALVNGTGGWLSSAATCVLTRG